jgi:hypothetical protein
VIAEGLPRQQAPNYCCPGNYKIRKALLGSAAHGIAQAFHPRNGGYRYSPARVTVCSAPSLSLYSRRKRIGFIFEYIDVCTCHKITLETRVLFC